MSAPSEVRLLAVTHGADDWPVLREVAQQQGWNVTWADSTDSAVAALAAQSIAVVICDRDLAGQEWRSILRRIAQAGRGTFVLLASPVSDVYLWKEVSQNGGFDVLTKPFQRERLIRAVNLALVARESRSGNHAFAHRVQY